MINNRDCFFYKKSDFINRLQDISPDSVCYIADTQQIYTHGRYFECNVTQDVVEQLIQNHGYLTAADLPVLTGGASPTPGEYVTGVSVGGHNVNVQKGKLSEINVGSASKLETPRKIELSGDLSGSIMFDGSQDVNIETIVHNSTTADRLTTPRTISLTGDVTGSTSFNGAGNVSIATTVANNSHTHTFSNITDKPISASWSQGNNNNITTAQFLDLLEEAGAFKYGWFHVRGMWSYADTCNITDTGYGTLDLAGSAILVWGVKSYCTILVIPPLNSGTSSTVALGNIYIYVKNGTDYTSGWRKIAKFEDIDWNNIINKPSSFTPSSHTHTISQISNLNASWDSLLANAPSAYLTRWPSISEVTGKQNLTIRLNGGTTEGTNQFTYNGTTAKTLSITPSSIGAATSSHSHSYLPLSGGTMTGTINTCRVVGMWITGKTNAAIKFNSLNPIDSNSAWFLYNMKSASGNVIAFGGLGDNIGFYTYDAARTENGTDSSFLCNTNTGVWTFSNTPTVNGTSVSLNGHTHSWSSITSKPSWIGSSKPSYSWNEISGKPSSYTPSSHTHTASQVSGLATVATSGSYNDLTNKPTIPTIPSLSVTNSGSGNAVTGITVSGHTITVTKGTISSIDTKNTTGTSNSTQKLYLVGGMSQSNTGVVTYSNNAVYTQSGQLYASQMNATNGFFETSDARLKDFKEDIKALDTVDQITTKYFTWKEDESKELQIGTSAQEVEKLYPELVSKTGDDTLTVDYAKLSIIALAAIKELKAEIQSLKEEIKQLKSNNYDNWS